jgi:hypothetical protein
MIEEPNTSRQSFVKVIDFHFRPHEMPNFQNRMFHRRLWRVDVLTTRHRKLPMIVERITPVTNAGIMMDITMDTGTLPRAKRTIIVGPTNMTIIRKACTMVAMPATTQDIVTGERDITTTITMIIQANPSNPGKTAPN